MREMKRDVDTWAWSAFQPTCRAQSRTVGVLQRGPDEADYRAPAASGTPEERIEGTDQLIRQALQSRCWSTRHRPSNRKSRARRFGEEFQKPRAGCRRCRRQRRRIESTSPIPEIVSRCRPSEFHNRTEASDSHAHGAATE